MLDSYCRFIVYWDLRVNIKLIEVAVVKLATLEKIPDIHPCYITGYGKQFTGKEFRYFLALHSLIHM